MSRQHKKSILLYCTQLMKTGGIESHVLEFCRLMWKEGIETDLIVPNFQMSNENMKLTEQWCRRVYTANGKPGLRNIMWLLSIRVFLLKKYDALYTNGQGNSILLISRFFRKRSKWVHHHHTAGDSEDQKTWTKAYMKALLTADKVIACSRKNADDMEQSLKREIDVITCFSRQIHVKNQKPEGGPLHFGYYGRLIPEKGIDIICRLSNCIDHHFIQFHLWGEGEQYPAEYFVQYPNLIYHGIFNGVKELTDVISGLDAYLLLSSHPEGLPISLLEVMSAGVPWLATDKGGIRDIACDSLSNRILTNADDFELVKTAVIAFAKDIKTGKISTEKQKENYNRNFSPDILCKKWKEAFSI